MQGVLADEGRLLQREAAEGHGGVAAVDQIDPLNQEVRCVRQHVAVQEQQVAGAGVGGKAVAAPGPALVGEEAD